MDALVRSGSRDASKGGRSGFFGVVLGLAILFEDTLGDQPEFSRMACSILSAISGFVFKNALEFSRP